MEKARLGDRDALATMYRCYHARIAAALRRRLPAALRAKYDTMDLAQSVFMDVMRDLPRFDDRGERAFVALLTRRAENKIRDKLRRHLGKDGRRAERRLATDAQFPAADAAEAAGPARFDDFARLRRVLDGLDAPDRAMLRLHAQGATFARIASELGLVSAEAARKRHARILAGLRDRWTNERR
jgi:RNA polymerase sigma factor (sigma-70 family)